MQNTTQALKNGMSIVSHLIAFLLGSIATVIASVIIFYTVILKKIQKNEIQANTSIYKQVELAGDPIKRLQQENSSVEVEEKLKPEIGRENVIISEQKRPTLAPTDKEVSPFYLFHVMRYPRKKIRLIKVLRKGK